MKQLLVIFVSIFFYFSSVLGQTPTVQDCAGAIPICQDVYSEINSFVGTGNFPNEIYYPVSCTYEQNSVWYTFTAQTSGNFSFIITPNNTSGYGDDYDWSVFNLTNATCADIYLNSALEISCNSWGDLYSFNGQTGASTAMGGYGNHNGPGNTNGPEFNADIPVTAGGTYVMMVSNWTGSTMGYTVDFGSSTAQIYDNIPPYIESILSNVGCGATSITFQFSENILCSTIAACDLTLTGPGGPYTITNVTGTSCQSGGTQERIFTIDVNPAITTTGTYSLNLDAAACNSVTDLCGNVAPSGSLQFNVTAITTSVSTQDANCGQSNGTATVTVSGGSGNYTYEWSTNPPQYTAIASNLAAGIYTVSVSDGSCTSTTSATITNIGSFTLQMSVVDETCGQVNGSATVTPVGATGNFTYQWSTTPSQTTQTALNLAAGNYYVTVSDGICMTIDTAILSNNANFSAFISNIQNASCGMSDGSATVTVTTGTQPINYIWSTNPPQTSGTASNLAAGNYNVTVSDAAGCSTVLTVVINSGSGPVATIAAINAHCDHADGSATVTVTGGSGNYTYLWSNGQTTSFIDSLFPGAYTVTVNDGNCDASATAIISNQPGPLALFNYHPNPITIDNADVIFTSLSESGSSWLWDFGDGTGSLEGESVMHPFYSVDDYLVTLIVTDEFGCSDTMQQWVTVHDIFTIYIPSSFTPDGDGLNDVFQAYGISWEENTYEMMIYDRWGKLFYQTTDPTKPWNGGYNNNPDRADKRPGVYVYSIRVKGLNYQEKIYLGRVTLLR